jgi:periplasmic divalent cation tolerance protein
MAADKVLIYMTAGSEAEADRVGEALLDANLVACVNILPGMRSLYRWQGKVARDPEVTLIAKTRADLVDRVTALVKQTHSYDCPCVVSLPIEGGNPEFLDWIAQETEGA